MKLSPTNTGRPRFNLSPGERTPTSQAAQQAVGAQNYSIDSEQLILTSALLASGKDDEGALGRERTRQQVLDLLADTDFYLEQHASIWQIIRSLCEAGKPADVAAVADASASLQLFIGGAPYLMGMIQNPINRVASEKSILAAAQRVKGLSMLRQLETVLDQSRAMCFSGSSFDLVAANAQEDIKNLVKKSTTSRPGAKHVSEYCIGIIDTLMAAADGQVVNTKVTPSGFESLDEVIMGFADEDFVVLAARPSMGKTSFALALAENCSAHKAVLIFSLEMTGEALTRRCLSRSSRVSMNALRRNELGNEDWSRISEGVEHLNGTPIYIDDTPGLTKEEIRSRARAFARNHPQCLIIVDYLQIVSNDGRGDARVHTAEVSQGLKQMARELKAPVIALSQLSRAVEQRPNKRPILSDLRESGSIEQDADLIVFLYRDEYYNKDTKDPGIAEVIIGKQREGPTATVKMGYEGKTMTWVDLGQVYTE